jgi:hypothetical protein
MVRWPEVYRRADDVREVGRASGLDSIAFLRAALPKSFRHCRISEHTRQRDPASSFHASAPSCGPRHLVRALRSLVVRHSEVRRHGNHAHARRLEVHSFRPARMVTLQEHLHPLPIGSCPKSTLGAHWFCAAGCLLFTRRAPETLSCPAMLASLIRWLRALRLLLR